MRLFKLVFSMLFTFVFFLACSKKNSTDADTATTAEDTSAGGAAASAVGGAIAASDSNGKVALYQNESRSIWNFLLMPAFAATECPRVTTANGSGCTNAGNVVDLTYSSCSFGTAGATWTGLLELSLSSGAMISCGTFPTPGSSSLQRQFVSAAGIPGTATRTNSRGTAVVIDHQTANLGNFDGVTIAASIGTGYGTKVTFNGSGARTGVSVRQRTYVNGGFDHSVVGDITVSESGTTRTTSGTVTVYHNKAKVVGTSTFTNVTYDNTSCVPVSGSISTAFAAGTNVAPTVLGSAFVGKSETLTFTGSGTATLVETDGTSTTVTLTHCY